jgi:hypothetical protein
MKWVIHIGLHKAASTSLQRAFAGTPGILYLGKFGTSSYRDTATHTMVRDYLANVSEHGLDMEHVGAWKAGIERSARELGMDCVVISDEVMSMSGRAFPYPQLAVLRKAFGSDVLIIRNQFDWIRSCYMQQLRMGITCTYQHFVAWHTAHLQAGRFSSTQYASICRFMASSGISGTVLPFEHLVDNESPHGNLGRRLGLDLPRLPRENRSPFELSVIAWLEFNRSVASRRPRFKEARFDGHYRKRVDPRLRELGCDMDMFDGWYAMLAGVRREYEALNLPPAADADRAFMTLPGPLVSFLTGYFREQNKGIEDLLGIDDLASRGYVVG